MKLFTKIVLLLFLTTSVYAQKAKVTKGDWSDLNGIKKFNIVFDYKDLEIIDYDSEEAYIERKMKDAESKEAGAGAQFKKKWLNDRANIYEPDFIKGFNADEPEHAKVGKNNGAEYTMKIVTRKIYPGYNVAVKRKPCKLYFTVLVYKTSSPSHVIFSADMDKSQSTSGLDAHFEDGPRIGNAYYKGAIYFKRMYRLNVK